MSSENSSETTPEVESAPAESGAEAAPASSAASAASEIEVTVEAPEPRMTFNIFALVGSVLLLVGFFLNWVELDPEEGPIGGLGMATLAATQGGFYYAAYALPVLAIALAALSFKKPRLSSALSIAVGGLLILWGVVEVARFLYQQTFAGLWLSVLGAAVMLLGGLWSWKRTKPKKAAKKKPEPAQ